MSRIQAALDAARRRLRQATAQPFVYRRGRKKYPIEATITIPNAKNAETHHDVTIGVERRDFILDADQIPFKPQRDDEIIDGKTVYVVMFPIAGEERCFRYMTPDKKLMRIHAVEKS